MENMFTFEIKKQVGTLASHESGWNKELNIVSWNGNPDKLDIRDWNPSHECMSRGLTFSFKEGVILYELLQQELKAREYI